MRIKDSHEPPVLGCSGANKYTYNGKEWNNDFGLGLNDYGARMYDPAMARWTSIDPLAEAFSRWSPYHYGKDNPIKFIDPTGMASEAYSFGTQSYEKSSDDIMQEQQKKAEDSKKDNKDKVELYFTNSTGGTINKLNATQLVSIIAKAGKIMKRNGIEKNISFKQISTNKAEQYTMGSKNVGFVALISHPFKAYGNSSRVGDSRIGVYDYYEMQTTKSFVSWVNYGRISDEKNNFPDALYGTAFSMAHEYLHQLLYFASTALDNDPYKFSHSDDSVPNLNTDGGSDRNRTHTVNYPLYPGNGYEVILPAHKAYLNRYFEYLKTH